MNMDMSPTATAPAGAASPTNAPAMNMDMDMGGGCKISMLWNWDTIDTCFISSTWHITSTGMFAGSCIGVILLVMSLEFLRRAVKEYDRFLVRQHGLSVDTKTSTRNNTDRDTSPKRLVSASTDGVKESTGFRPTVFQQAVRAGLHTVQFAVAYFVMLLAMYYNGYLIICIFIGAFIGSFVFQWETLGSMRGNKSTSAANEATVCCG